MPNFSLRYDATFKVSKFESSLFYKIVLHVVVVLHVCKKLPLALDCSWSKYSFPMLFPVLEFLAVKKTELIFCCIVLLHLWAQKVSQVFKTLFQTGAINSPGAREEIFSPFGTQDVTQNFKPLPRGNQLGYFWGSLGFWATQ